jgi:hypothetical protein
MGAELLHADRQTDPQTDRHDEANSRFSEFCERASLMVAVIISPFQKTGLSVGAADTAQDSFVWWQIRLTFYSL